MMQKTEKRRPRWGLFSLLFASLAVIGVVMLYASFAAQLFRPVWATLTLGALGALVIPSLIAWKFHILGPRVLAFFNLAVLVGFYVLLGEPTARALQQHGLHPFAALSEKMYPGAQESLVLSVGRAVVGFMLLPSGKSADALVIEAEPEEPPTPTEPTPRRAPTPRPPKAKPAPTPTEPTQPIELAEALPPDPSPGEVPALVTGSASVLEIPIGKDGGVFKVGAIVNGDVPTEFIFDSGASDVSITTVLARRLGLDETDAIEFRNYRTANGTVRQPVVILKSVRLAEGFEVKNLEGSICSGCSDNLLGRSFQKHFLVEIDSAASVIRLRKNSASGL